MLLLWRPTHLCFAGVQSNVQMLLLCRLLLIFASWRQNQIMHFSHFFLFPAARAGLQLQKSTFPNFQSAPQWNQTSFKMENHVKDKDNLAKDKYKDKRQSAPQWNQAINPAKEKKAKAERPWTFSFDYFFITLTSLGTI